MFRKSVLLAALIASPILLRAESADVGVTISSPSQVAAGTTYTNIVNIVNLGPDLAFSLVVTSAVPAGMNLVSAAQLSGFPLQLQTNASPITGGFPIVAPGPAAFQVVIQVPSDVPNGSVLTNTASASSGTSDPNPANNSTTALTTVRPLADLSVVVAAPPFVTAGQSDLTPCTVQFSNSGPSDASNTVVTLLLPMGFSFASVDSLPSNFSVGQTNGNEISFNASDMPAGQNATIVVHVAAGSSAGGRPGNSVAGQIYSLTTDPYPANNNYSVPVSITTISDISVALTPNQPSVVAGTELTYSAIVSNAGPSDSPSVALNDYLPAGVSLVSQDPPSGSIVMTTNGIVSDTLGLLTAGQSIPIHLVVSVGPSVPNGTVLTNLVSVNGYNGDTDPSNNSSQATTPVSTEAELAIEITNAPAVQPGGMLAYGVTVTNRGPSDAQNIALIDFLPAGATFVSQLQSAGPAFELSGISSSTYDAVATLLTGASASFQVTVQVAPGAADGVILTNSAEIFTTTFGTNTGLNLAESLATVVNQGPDTLTLTLSNGAHLRFRGAPGQSYSFEAASSPAGPYSNLAPAVAADSAGLLRYGEPIVPGGARFYRVVAP